MAGKLGETEQQHPWKIIKKQTEASEKDCLTREFTTRLEERPVKYKLQIQFHTPTNEEEKNLSVWNGQKVRLCSPDSL